MNRDSILDTGGPVRSALLAGLVVLVLGTCGAPVREHMPASMPLAASGGCGTVEDFYRAHPRARIWTKAGAPSAEARLIQAGLSVDQDGDAQTKEHRLSEALVLRARTLAAPPGDDILYIDEAVRPRVPCASVLLEEAAAAPSISAFVDRLEAPNALVRTLLSATGAGGTAIDTSQRDLALARLIGAPARAVVVDTTSARLWMLQEGQVVGTMKVIVGKDASRTPQMAGLIRFVALSPYWNVPPDLVRKNFAPRVMSLGPSYLKQHGYEVVDRYGLDARRLDPATVDWAAVAAGTTRVGIRQVPGADNMMGAAKFMFPNRLGIYLHDTPHRWMFDRNDRRLSNGCVRLERAGELYRWMSGQGLPAADPNLPERRVLLSAPVPVYLFSFSEQAAKALERAASAQA